MQITLAFCFSQLLVWLGLYGIILRRDNLIITLICLEIALLGVALSFAASAALLGDVAGLIMFFALLTLAGVESALGLALVITYYRSRSLVRWSALAALKG